MPGNIALGKYRLVRPLGRGSNGEVFLAEPITEPGKQVVVKRMHAHITSHPKFRLLFEAEVKSMENFSHPYAVQFIEAHADDPLGPCLVMEYVPGMTLEAVIRRNRRLDVDRVGKLLGCFCHALQAAHEAGIIHRDLKPANLMVTGVGTVKESIKVMDFGFAGFAAKPHLQMAVLTGEGPIHAIGTPAYVSPEMIRGDTVDWRSDLYSVGVILYEMLTGKLPFNQEAQEDLLAAHVHQNPPRFAKMGVTDVPAEVEEVVRTALLKYPNERPQSPQDLAELYGLALGINYWDAAAPVDWEPPVRTATEYTPQSRPAPELPYDPYRVTFEFELFTPESLAAVKIRGFVDDQGGEVLASEPGVIRLKLCIPGAKPKGGPGTTTTQKATPSGSGIFGWFRGVPKKPTVNPGEEPIEMELTLEKPSMGQNRLNVGVTCMPTAEYPPRDHRIWKARCEQLNMMLRRYLGA